MAAPVAAREVVLVDDRIAAEKKRHFRNTCIAAFSNLSTAYNLVNINLAHVLMQNQYCLNPETGIGGDNCKGEVTTAGTACLVGAIVGQLTFGYVGDCLGRGRALQLTMALSILGALASAFAVPINDDKKSVFIFLSITRLIMGVGVGGVYPLAATIAAESSNSANRGRSVSLVFSMQGIGTLMVPLVGMACLYGLGTDETRHDDAVTGIAWRLILGMGALPGIMLIPFKSQSSPEAQPSEVQAAPAPPGGGTLTLMQALRMRRYWKSLVGCAGGWFLFDITFYGNTLFAPTVLQAVFGKTDSSGRTPVIGHSLETNLCLQLMILALIGLPGYYISVWLMDSVGRKIIQIQGFVCMAVLYAALAIFLGTECSDVKGKAQCPTSYSVPLLLLYGLTYFSSNFGPNSTTFILPSESFPFEVRSSLNGFCAAMGKVGATVGAACFKPVVNATSPEVVFFMCSMCAAVGVIITVICIQDRRGMDMTTGQSFITTGGYEQKPDAGTSLH